MDSGHQMSFPGALYGSGKDFPISKLNSGEWVNEGLREELGSSYCGKRIQSIIAGLNITPNTNFH